MRILADGITISGKRPQKPGVGCASALEYHGRTFAVEGNRRLWAITQEAETLDKEADVKELEDMDKVADVKELEDTEDMYLGWIRQQRPPSRCCSVACGLWSNPAWLQPHV